MKFFMKECMYLSWAVVSIFFTIIPESIFSIFKIMPNFSDDINVIINRIFLCFIVLLIVSIVIAIKFDFGNSCYIKDRDFTIKITTKDIFKIKKCKTVIAFDECFTTTVGESPELVKPSSICGQYLEKYPINNIQELIDLSNLNPDESKSRYNNLTKYKSGKLVRRNDYLLMAFAKLDEIGLGGFAFDEYIEALYTMWKEIDANYAGKDVCISILGAGLTRMEPYSFTQQELLNIIIGTYKLSSKKIKHPNKLIISCKEQDGFSMKKIY